MTERPSRMAKTLWLAVALVLPLRAEETNLIEILRKAQEALTSQPGPKVEEAPKEHLLTSQDVVQLQVYEEPDLSLPRATIARDGTISHPVLGPLAIGGKTLEQARAMIHGLLARDYLVNPRVSLTVLEYARGSFTILNQVVKPGTYNWPGNETMTLLKAIALAGGPTRLASLSKVTVQRVVNGERKVYRFDLEQMIKSRDAVPFLIQSGDIVDIGGKGQ